MFSVFAACTADRLTEDFVAVRLLPAAPVPLREPLAAFLDPVAIVKFTFPILACRYSVVFSTLSSVRHECNYRASPTFSFCTSWASLSQRAISCGKMLALRLRRVTSYGETRCERWSVTKQVGQLDVQEAYTETQGNEMAAKKSESKRELIDTGTDKRYVRRDDQGQFSESDDQGRSLAQDVKKAAKTKVKSGKGDRGDQKRK